MQWIPQYAQIKTFKGQVSPTFCYWNSMGSLPANARKMFYENFVNTSYSFYVVFWFCKSPVIKFNRIFFYLHINIQMMKRDKDILYMLHKLQRLGFQ